MSDGEGWPWKSFVSYRTAHLDSTEVDLLTRRGSEVADPMAKDLLPTLDKPSSIKAQRLIRLTCEVPPLKREDAVGQPAWTTACPSN